MRRGYLLSIGSWLCLSAILSFVSSLAWSETFQVPLLREPVQDEAGLFSGAAVNRMSSFLRDLRTKGGPQVQVLTLDSLAGLPIEEASIKVVEAWNLGGKQKDDGVLFLIAKRERKLRIEVGQGLEGELPDVVAKRIISRIVVPLLKAGRNDQALEESIIAILGYVAPQFLEGQGLAAPEARDEGERSSNGLILLIFFLFIGVSLLRAIGGRHFNGRGYGSGGGFGGFPSGGRSGGGWSGGGGGFSGGGASGDW